MLVAFLTCCLCGLMYPEADRRSEEEFEKLFQRFALAELCYFIKDVAAYNMAIASRDFVRLHPDLEYMYGHAYSAVRTATLVLMHTMRFLAWMPMLLTWKRTLHTNLSPTEIVCACVTMSLSCVAVLIVIRFFVHAHEHWNNFSWGIKTTLSKIAMVWYCACTHILILEVCAVAPKALDQVSRVCYQVLMHGQVSRVCYQVLMHMNEFQSFYEAMFTALLLVALMLVKLRPFFQQRQNAAFVYRLLTYSGVVSRRGGR